MAIYNGNNFIVLGVKFLLLTLFPYSTCLGTNLDLVSSSQNEIVHEPLSSNDQIHFIIKVKNSENI